MTDISANRPIVPRSGISATSLTIVIAIMTFLAGLTLGGILWINEIARNWQKDATSQISVQIRPQQGENIAENIERAKEVIGKFDGILSAETIGEEESLKLLEPWLGTNFSFETLPVPRLIAVTVNPENPPDLGELEKRIRAQVPSASLDDHRKWSGHVSQIRERAIWGGAGVIALVLIATVLTVVFATRGAMAANENVIDVLGFVGAEKSYIARQFQKHFLILGLKGASLGGIGAIAILQGSGFAPILGAIAIIACLTAATAGATVMRGR